MLAGMSSGTSSPSSRPVSSLRIRYLVPNRWEPCDSDSEPIEDQPWLFRITRITLTRSETIVAISCGAIWKVPSPMIDHFALGPGHLGAQGGGQLVAHAGVAVLQV